MRFAGAAAPDSPDAAASEQAARPIAGRCAVAPDSKLFVQVKSGGELAGNGGCNRFFGRYKITGDAIEIGPLGATRMACPEPAMALEARFLAALEAARLWHRDRTSLILLDAERHDQARLLQTDAD